MPSSCERSALLVRRRMQPPGNRIGSIERTADVMMRPLWWIGGLEWKLQSVLPGVLILLYPSGNDAQVSLA